MNIQEVLTQANLTQESLAELIVREFGGKLSQSGVSKWAHRGIPLDRKAQIARVTGIPLKQIAPELFRTD